MLRLVCPLLVVGALAAAAPAPDAQLCPVATDTFWKNDILPDNPGGALPVSVIPGLCEGEAVASVFTIPGGAPLQEVTQVSVGFGSAGGAHGATALVNIEIYDGVTFSGKDAFLGPKVFDLEASTGASAQVTSTAINTFDMTQFGVTVGNDPSSKFVVAFRMSFNPNGSCAGGHTSNFFTDNTQGGIFGCDPAITIPQKNLIDVNGEPNWQDSNGATVGGVALCPLFLAGNWVNRACTRDDASSVCQPDIGFQGPGTASLSVCGDPLTPLGSADVLLENVPVGAPCILFGGIFNNPVPVAGGFLVPFPWDVLEVFAADGNGEVLIPNVGSAAGPVNFFVQFLASDIAQPQGFQFSNAVRMEFL